MLSTDKKIKELKTYFEKEPKVILAFLFGSFTKGRMMEESDIDIGIYLKDKNQEDEIWSRVSRIVKMDVDLVCLNDAPASLVSNIFKTGIPLKIGDKTLYWELYLQKSTEAEDFVEFAQDFWRIAKKAKSLNEEEKIRLLKRLDYLRIEMKELARFKKFTYQDYFGNRDNRKLIEKWCENILNALIDISKIILSSENKDMPRSYEESLRDFALMVGFHIKEAEKFSSFAKLRNILAHEYLDILYGRIQHFIKEFPGFYKKISLFLEKYLK